MNVLKKFILIFLFLIKILNASEFNTKFKVNVIPVTNIIKLNQNLTVRVEIEYTGKLNDYLISEPYIEKFHNFELMSTSVESITENYEKSTNIKIIKKSYIYTLKPLNTGTGYFPKTKIAILDKNGKILDQLETQSIEIKILKPEKKKNYKILIIILTSIIFLCLILTIILHYHKKSQLKKINITEEKPKPIEFDFISKLNETFESIKNPRQFYIHCNDLLKNYLELKFNIKLKHKTTAEAINIIKNLKLLNEEIIKVLTDILNEMDLVKYALNPLSEEDRIKLKEKINLILNNLININQ